MPRGDVAHKAAPGSNRRTSSASRGWSRSRCARAAGTCAWTSSGRRRTRCRSRRGPADEVARVLFLLSKSERYFYDADAIRESTSLIQRRTREAPGAEAHRRYATADLESRGWQRTSPPRIARSRRSQPPDGLDATDGAVQGRALRDVPAAAGRALHPRRHVRARLLFRVRRAVQARRQARGGAARPEDPRREREGRHVSRQGDEGCTRAPARRTRVR
jgi:hypothetical protein